MPEKVASGGNPGQPKRLSAGTFQQLLKAFQEIRLPLVADDARAAAERRREELKRLIEGQNGDRRWRDLLHQATRAAEWGAHEYLLLRFPCEACTDSGRAITQKEPHWPETLKGDAAAIYNYWRDHLQAGGFQLEARILEFSQGIPTQLGLFLVWLGGSALGRGSAQPRAPGAPEAGAAAKLPPSPEPMASQAKAVLLLTASGALVILTSHGSILDPGLVEKLDVKGVRKFVAFEIPIDIVKQRYANHFVVVAHDLHQTDDLRVLDFDGQHAFQLFQFHELGEPVFHEAP